MLTPEGAAKLERLGDGREQRRDAGGEGGVVLVVGDHASDLLDAVGTLEEDEGGRGGDLVLLT